MVSDFVIRKAGRYILHGITTRHSKRNFMQKHITLLTWASPTIPIFTTTLFLVLLLLLLLLLFFSRVLLVLPLLPVPLLVSLPRRCFRPWFDEFDDPTLPLCECWSWSDMIWCYVALVLILWSNLNLIWSLWSYSSIDLFTGIGLETHKAQEWICFEFFRCFDCESSLPSSLITMIWCDNGTNTTPSTSMNKWVCQLQAWIGYKPDCRREYRLVKHFAPKPPY